MPALTELADLQALADAARTAQPLNLVVDPDAETLMRTSVERSGLLVLGELHGVRQTPQVVAALVELLDIGRLALEWPKQLTATVDTYRNTGVLHDHDLLWLGDGRLTTGHLGLLRDLAVQEPPVEWLAFDTWSPARTIPGESEWTARDHAMAHRILDHTETTERTLVVAGDAHTPATRTRNGIPMGSWLAQVRPGVRSIAPNYGQGLIYNLGSKPILTRTQPTRYRLRVVDGDLVLDHPSPTEADVPHRGGPELFAADRIAPTRKLP